jgi:hypothetical protein
MYLCLFSWTIFRKFGYKITKNEQNSNFNKESILLSANYFSKFKDYKWVLSTGFSSTKNSFKSSLLTIDNNNVIFSNDNYNNSNNYSFSFPYSNLNIVLTKKKFSIKVELELQYYDIVLNDFYKNHSINDKEFAFI